MRARAEPGVGGPALHCVLHGAHRAARAECSESPVASGRCARWAGCDMGDGAQGGGRKLMRR